jgi:hypothetical protein
LVKSLIGMAALLVAFGVSAQQPKQWPPESLNITVKFADGTRVPLTLRNKQFDWWPSDPTQDGPANVARLVPLANAGDIGAAFGLSQFLNDCKTAPRDEARVEAWVKTLREKRLLTWREGETTPLPADSPLDQYENSYRAKFRRCKGLKPADLVAADQWQRKAADGGHLWALIYLYQDNNANLTPAQRLDIARKTWEIGQIGGLDRVARGLEDVNRVESVAYLVLEERLHAAIAEAADFPSTKSSAQMSARSLEYKLRDLTPDERKRAADLAKTLLQKNRNCCLVQ